MLNPDLSLENDAARAELNALANRLGPASLGYSIGSSWTIGTCLCHLAFWDQRALFLLKQWQKNERIGAARLDATSIDSINHAVNQLARHIPGPAALKLALDSAAAVDAFVAGIGDELAVRITAAGFERHLRRSLHRREHLQRIREALDVQSAPG